MWRAGCVSRAVRELRTAVVAAPGVVEEALRPRKDRCLNIDHSPRSSKLRQRAAPPIVVTAVSSRARLVAWRSASGPRSRTDRPLAAGARRDRSDAAGTVGRQLPGRGFDGDLRARSVPSAVRGARADHADHRPRSPHEPADDEPGLGAGQCRVRRGHGAGGPVRPASAAAADDGPVRGPAADRLHPDGGGSGPGDVHRRPGAAGPVHEPAPDRGGSAAGPRFWAGAAA